MPPDSSLLARLLARAAEGDQAAFAEVYRRTSAHLFGLAHRMLGRDQLAEDVLQEAFVSIWKSAGQYCTSVDGQEVQPMTWLIAIVRNKALDALRSQARRKEVALEPDGGDDDGNPAGAASPSALELLSQAAQARHIETCLGGLDGSHRQSLALAYYQGLSHGEVAAQMGAPLGTVKAWIRRGLDKLKACLEQQTGAAP